MSKRLGTAIILDLYTGMRRGELLALTWDDIDFENQIITINKQLNRLKNFDATNKLSKTSLVIRPYTKTSMGRKVAVSPKIIRLLLQHKKNQELKRNEIGDLYKDENLIFCHEDDRRIDPQNFIKSYTDILKHANVNYIKFYALRHTFATRALEAGIPVKVVNQILGHANIGITLDTYSHVLSELQNKAMQTITDKFLSIEI